MPSQPLIIDSELLKACIHCGFCLPTCPTYGVSGSEAQSPRGRLYLMQRWLDHPESEQAQAIMPAIDSCLGCVACETACPSGVQYGQLLEQTRESLVVHRKGLATAFKRWLLSSLLSRPRLLRRVGQVLAGFQQVGVFKVLGRFVPQARLLPNLQPSLARPWLHHGQVFEPVFSTNASTNQVLARQTLHVGLLTGCMMPTVYNHIHHDTVFALNALGVRVTIIADSCCGALATHAGFGPLARQQMSQLESQLEQVSGVQVLISNAAGCGAHLKQHLTADKPVMDILEFIDSLLTADEALKKRFSPVHETVTYQAACHLHHAQKVQETPYRLLGLIPSLTVVPMTDASTCCGSAGIYNVEHPDMAQALLAQKHSAILETGAQTVLAANPGCLLQLQSARLTHMRYAHPISVLAQSLR